MLQTVIARAINGDMQAAALLLPRIHPPRKGRPLVIDLPPIRDAADVVEAHRRITVAVSRGEVSLEEANALADLVDRNRQAITTHELAVQLAEVKARLAEREGGDGGER